MTDHKSKSLRAGLTRTQTSTHTDVRIELTAEEERTVRMLHGLGEGPDFALSSKVSRDPEVNARLALIEASLLAELHDQGPLAEAADPKSRILAHLQRIEGEEE